ncbi:MAG: AAA family ATPase [Steroidobacteraceae bacterium]
MGVRDAIALERLREDGEFVLLRELPEGTPGPVLVLMPVAEQPTAASLRRLEHELSLAAELDSRWAVRPVALSRQASRTVLILEDPGGELLERHIGQPLEITEFLPLAIAITAAVSEVHARGLIHKDIKPANILVDRAGHARLTGFGIASRAPRESQQPESLQILSGTLPYMAPEQTGRMNRSIDARSDLYSLGVTFYRLLTGRLPFAASDALGWIHCHIALQPASPREHRALPEPLADIILKLLAKSAAERYQSAAGLQADLQHCLAQWLSQGSIDVFALGQHDAPDRLGFPETLYGREPQLAVLRSVHDRMAAAGTSVLMLVSGHAGVGKSALVHELQRELVQSRSWFALGKFDQYRQDIPYATLMQACSSLVRQLLGRADAQITEWRERMLAALGEHGQLITGLVPELELVVGQQPPAPEVPPQDVLNRFRRVFRRFLGVFARPEQPLVLFLDDLQWMDAATVDLLEYVLTEPEIRHLMVIGAYRDDEVAAAYTLASPMERLRGCGVRMQEIVLGPLESDDIGRLLSHSLHCARQHVEALARLVFEKTQGNPFFTIQFLTSLEEQGLLTRGPAGGGWQWDLKRIQAQGFTDNVAHLLVAKLNRLAVQTQQALARLACLGTGAGLEMLMKLLESSEQAVHEVYRDAVLAGLVIHVDHGYRFVHDRVQEAAYHLTPPAQRPALHLRIGWSLWSQMQPEQVEEHVFDLVNQLNQGRELLPQGPERRRLAELNLLAGQRARQSSAYAAALRYLVAGCALLPEEGWTQLRDLGFALQLHRAECEFLTGDLGAAEARLSALARQTGNSREGAAVCCLRQTLYQTLARNDRAVEVCLQYLRQVGIAWQSSATEDEVAQEYAWFWQQLGDRPVEELIDLPLLCDPHQQAILDVLAAVLAPALLTDTNLFRLAIGRMANLSLQYGNGDASLLAYSYLNFIVGNGLGDYATGFRFAKLAVDLLDKGMQRFKARVEIAFGTTAIPWTKPMRGGLPWARRSIQTAQECGDLTFACYSWALMIPLLLSVGEPLEGVQREAQQGLEFARKMHFGSIVGLIESYVAFVRALRGLTVELGSLSHESFDEAHYERRLAQDPSLRHAAQWYWLNKLQAHFHAEDYAAAAAAAANAKRNSWVSLTVFEASEYHFYTALVQAKRFESCAADERLDCRRSLLEHAESLATLAANGPENFGPRATLVAAEMARLEGRESDAQLLYEQAIRAARDNGFVQIEALAFELAARFYAGRGLEIVSSTLLRNARACYERWGAAAKVRLLEQRHPGLREEPSLRLSSSTITTPIGELDALSVFGAAQAVSSEIVLEKLLQRLLLIAIKHAGAERGLLVLMRNGRPLLEAETTATGPDTVAVSVKELEITSEHLPQTILHFVIRTHERVLLEDATTSNLFSTDEYVRQHRPRSVLCQPLAKQGRLIGVLYLENKLAAGAFSARTAVLDVLAAQAAISLENAYLYADLHERESRIRGLIDSNVVAICFWAGGRIRDANEAFARLVGFSREELMSSEMNFRERTPQEYHARDDQWFQELRSGKAAAPYEKEYLRRDGTRVPVLVGGALLAGNDEEGVAFVIDLTERRHAEQERHARRVAEAANRAKGEFLAMMSHELRTPLNGILGYAQILIRDAALSARQRQSATVIRHSGEHLLTLINDILDLAKIEAGKLGLEFGAVHLGSFLRGIHEIILVQAQEKALKLVWQTAPDLPTAVRADERRLRQILLNLLSNAVKFTDRGQVSLLVSCSRPGRVRFDVRDTGIGIRADQLDVIFQPFEQVDEVRRGLRGTGLGLAISRQLVRLMGGEIGVESRPAQGSLFWFEVDVQAVRTGPAVRGPTGVMIGYEGPRKTLLVIDDVAENRSMLVDLLTPLGFELSAAASGREALEHARVRPADLVLTDLVMPEMNGWETTRRLRELPGMGRVPVIIVSADASGSHAQEFVTAGADGFVSKPINTEELLLKIVTLLKLRPVLRGGHPLERQHALELVVPPAQELELLHRLAEEGDMRQIIRWAEHVCGLDQRYSPFTEQVRNLASQYQSRAVLSLVEQHLAGRG